MVGERERDNLRHQYKEYAECRWVVCECMGSGGAPHAHRIAHNNAPWRVLVASVANANQLVDAFAAIAFLNTMAMPIENDELIRPICLCVDKCGLSMQGSLRLVFSSADNALQGTWGHLETGTTESIGGVQLDVIDTPESIHAFRVLYWDASVVLRAQKAAVRKVGEIVNVALDAEDPIFRGAVQEGVESFLTQACGLKGLSMRMCVPQLQSRSLRTHAPPMAEGTSPTLRVPKVAPFQLPPYLSGSEWLCEAFGTSLNLEGDHRDPPAKSLYFAQIYQGVHY